MPATEAGKDRTKDPGLRPVKRLTGFFLGLDCRIPGPLIYISLNKNITIVIYLVLESTPTHVNKWAGYSAIAPVHSGIRKNIV